MERSIAQLSGGEKKRVALALGLGFAEVVAARGRLTSNVLILDEVRKGGLTWLHC
jgi:DNA repair exonuclease SbcCD ATPase subunit